MYSFEPSHVMLSELGPKKALNVGELDQGNVEQLSRECRARN